MLGTFFLLLDEISRSKMHHKVKRSTYFDCLWAIEQAHPTVQHCSAFCITCCSLTRSWFWFTNNECELFLVLWQLECRQSSSSGRLHWGQGDVEQKGHVTTYWGVDVLCCGPPTTVHSVCFKTLFKKLYAYPIFRIWYYCSMKSELSNF